MSVPSLVSCLNQMVVYRKEAERNDTDFTHRFDNFHTRQVGLCQLGSKGVERRADDRGMWKLPLDGRKD